MEAPQIKSPIELYFETYNPKYLAEDTVFIDLGTNELTIGREAVGKMLRYIYYIAFDAHTEITNTIITNSNAVLEANFIGKHISKFAGIPATNKNVNVPFCVTYELENGLVKVARLYFLDSILIKQLTD